MKVRDVIKAIEDDGWRFHSERGSHRQYVHPTKQGRVTIAGHLGHDMHGGTLTQIFRQAQIPKPRSS